MDPLYVQYANSDPENTVQSFPFAYSRQYAKRKGSAFWGVTLSKVHNEHEEGTTLFSCADYPCVKTIVAVVVVVVSRLNVLHR